MKKLSSSQFLDPGATKGRGWLRTLGVRAGSPVRNQRGSTAVLLAAGMLVSIAGMGLALEFGRMYVYRAQFVRALDAGALAAIRSMREGHGNAEKQALALVEANGLVDGEGGASVGVVFGTNSYGEETVEMNAELPVPMMFSKLFGRESYTLRSSATAAARPLDVVLVLDQSGSLEMAGAWDELQDAAQDFVEHFSDDYDQMGLVSFHLRAFDRVPLGPEFSKEIPKIIKKMDAEGATNTGEGLRYALGQMQSQAVRERSTKVVVFFTDGLPTVYRGKVGGHDRLLSANQYMTQYGSFVFPVVLGCWDSPDLIPDDGNYAPNGCNKPSRCQGDWNCLGWTAYEIVDAANLQGEEMANAIRSEGIYVYTIGLDDPSTTPIDADFAGYLEYMFPGAEIECSEYCYLDQVPNMEYLRTLANENGIADSRQPRGQAYLAPTADDLARVFQQVADDIVIRLAH